MVVVVAMAAAYWAGTRHGDDPEPGTPLPAFDATTDSGDAGAGDEVARQIRALSTISPAESSVSGRLEVNAPLPAADVPVRELIAQLDERARRGDARAACRLGIELLRCKREHGQAHIRDLLQAAVQQRDSEVSNFEVDLLAKMEDRQDASLRRCDGIGPEDWQRAHEYQQLAAERGDVRMRLWYVAEPALETAFFLDDLEEWARYRSVARRYLDQALHAGLPEAPAVAARVHLPAGAIDPWATALRQPDAFQHFVYRELDLILNPQPPGGVPESPGWFDPSPQPGPEIDMDEVRAQAQRLREAWFAGHVPTQRESEESSDFSLGKSPERICAGGALP
jgi:hypothetical protein